MTAGALLALAVATAAFANHARRRWTSAAPLADDDWSKRWGWIFGAALLFVGASVGAHCGGAP